MNNQEMIVTTRKFDIRDLSEFEGKTRIDLINMIIELRATIAAMEKNMILSQIRECQTNFDLKTKIGSERVFATPPPIGYILYSK